MKKEKKRKIKTKKPLGIWIIGIFCYLATIFLILTAVISFTNLNILEQLPGFNLNQEQVPGIATYFGYFFIARGLLKFKNWARIALLIIATLNIIGGILSVVAGDYASLINLIVNLIIAIYLLFSKKVKKVFSKPNSQ